MGKKTTPETQVPEWLNELHTTGSTVITAPTREALGEMIDIIPADCKYASGAIGKNPETGAFTLRLHINP